MSNLTTEAGLQAYLKTRSISPSKITLLTGGTANFVYRVRLHDGTSFIYKHAAPYLHSNTNFAFDPARMDYEAWALEKLPTLLLHKERTDTCVKPVAIHSYDKNCKLLCIADGGDRNLKDAYADSVFDIPRMGRELGKWVAALHCRTRRTSMSRDNPADLEASNSIAQNLYRYSYQNLDSALNGFGHDISLAEQVNDEFGSKLLTDNECICHGDFWPGNVLVRSNFSAKEREQEQGPLDLALAIVDWEMVRRGTSATDVGQFAAEAFLLDRFRGGRGLLPAFLDAYVKARRAKGDDGSIGKEWLRRIAVHWAVHVAFWPTKVVWTDREGTRELVDIGVGVLKMAVEGDFKGLRCSELFKSVGDVWEAVWERE